MWCGGQNPVAVYLHAIINNSSLPSIKKAIQSLTDINNPHTYLHLSSQPEMNHLSNSLFIRIDTGCHNERSKWKFITRCLCGCWQQSPWVSFNKTSRRFHPTWEWVGDERTSVATSLRGHSREWGPLMLATGATSWSVGGYSDPAMSSFLISMKVVRNMQQPLNGVRCEHTHKRVNTRTHTQTLICDHNDHFYPSLNENFTLIYIYIININSLINA